MKETNFASASDSSRKQSSIGASMIMVVIFFLVLASWGGMKWYIKKLDNTFAQGQDHFYDVSKSFQGASVNRIDAFEKRLQLSQVQMKSAEEINSENFLKKLESITLPGVQIKKYEVNIEKRMVAITGLTNSFRYTAEQIAKFRMDPFFKGVTVGDFAKSEAGIITFSFTATF